MSRYFVLILGISFSVLIVKYRLQIKHIIGDVAWADKIFGAGGTYTMLVIVAILSFVLSLMYFFGTFQTFMRDYLGPLFGV
ncbi:MAG TPA: hypothetical protein PLJ21_13800 [Pseudobdellovibrionaceae bacterium]|nr:hypothetical protein [Pseudobdellovibrionaceae bacterium]